jgi:hypothetical protein
MSAVHAKKTSMAMKSEATEEPYSFLYVGLVAKTNNSMFFTLALANELPTTKTKIFDHNDIII